MKKTFLILLTLSALILTGCQQSVNVDSNAAIFDASKFTPANAEDVSIEDIDMNGDGISEKVLYYKSDDTVGHKSKTSNQHLVILSYQDSEWNIIIDDAFANSNVAGLRFLKEFYVIDLKSDGKQELFVQWSFERPLGIGNYYLIAFVDGEYKFLDSPELNELAHLRIQDGEAEIILKSLDATPNGINEDYSIYCEEDLENKAMVNRYEESCRQLKLTVNLNNGSLERQ